MMKVAAEHTIITKRPAQEIFHASSNMGWSAILQKIVRSRRCLSARLGMMRFCNISAYRSPVTVAVTNEMQLYNYLPVEHQYMYPHQAQLIQS
ncbi:hypothetical protein TNCV_232001 [Trichonephila clavipes]|nr:hypothetical protein TNCV_232001 [Trichonephila clavipes]